MADRSGTNDLAQIGLTLEGQKHLDEVMKTGWFSTQQDAYLLAISMALASNTIATPEQVRGAETRYNFVGGLDKEGRVRALIAVLRPDDIELPARTAERLAHAGLAILAQKITGEDALLSEALGYKEHSSQQSNGTSAPLS